MKLYITQFLLRATDVNKSRCFETSRVHTLYHMKTTITVCITLHPYYKNIGSTRGFQGGKYNSWSDQVLFFNLQAMYKK